MRKILIATTNHNKVSRIKRLLADVPVEIISLADLPTELPEPAETAESGIEIAAQKALGYVQYVAVRLKYGNFTDDNAIKY